jgi:hypothetical protein
MKKVITFLLIAIMLFSISPAFAWHNDYHHPRGYHYYKGRWWLGDAIVAGIALGTIIAELPPHCKTVYVGGVPYYYDGMYYFQRGPAGYIVVQPAVAPVVVAPPAVPVVAPPVQAPAAVANAPVMQNNSVTVRITNKNGSSTSVMLVRKGTGYVGPQGEYYEAMPTNEQLNALYGQ